MMKKIAVVCLVTLISFCGFSQTKPKPLQIEHVAGNVYVYTTYSLLGDTWFPANAMYVVTPKGVVMIDTPWDSTQFQPLLDSIQTKHHKKVVLCISTHFHDDRTIGVDFLKAKGVKTFCSKTTLDSCKTRGERQPQFYFIKDTSFNVGDCSIQTYYAGAGHTNDNIVIWVPKEKVLYGGCLIKSTDAIDLGNLKDANVKVWPATMQNLKRKFPDPSFVIPGHQGWKDKGSIDHTIELIKEYRTVKKS
ncbi:BlaB/IND/MUS family subclass B1 metallo-beta-lactamase [Pinibacter aurantiacus]|uniref:beta-lactamase n=1 Tax=Pinibacter aurantiacus TaxID=2851599 RepID=A0A9E2SET7_9BACT|nr:BlaB/IND/MUS family subclass B1 metallo-beta-lactamase [Pinibacter aurantiacus]MBV4360232.1 BlaB/IND/MUS family subclass B1 metallo-beta-lactamase [Pinibacter aurantiacus]